MMRRRGLFLVDKLASRLKKMICDTFSMESVQDRQLFIALVARYLNGRKMAITLERKASHSNPFRTYIRASWPICGPKFIEIGGGQLGTFPRQRKNSKKPICMD